MVYRQCIRSSGQLCELEVQVSDDNEVYVIKNGIIKRVKSYSDIMSYISTLTPAFRAIVIGKLEEGDKLYNNLYMSEPVREIHKTAEGVFSIWRNGLPSYVAFTNLSEDSVLYLPPSKLIEVGSNYFVDKEPLFRPAEKFNEITQNGVYIYGPQVCVGMRGCSVFGDEQYNVRKVDRDLFVIKLWAYYLILGKGQIIYQNNIIQFSRVIITVTEKGVTNLSTNNSGPSKLSVETSKNEILIKLDEKKYSLSGTPYDEIKFSLSIDRELAKSLTSFFSSVNLFR
ncbi:hypothetical protein [Sulfuracidifex metallicus]|uniref:hypothetical protein n=1 Tax=Sulfuracidifex metallicus TaxID=47303 RepID=UPI002272EDA4|nr:hypothetical protein [Sulfuracidifex metallicus]MCY0850257.1 hypothetical protein [Sulfuracidifex metallicus]